MSELEEKLYFKPLLGFRIFHFSSFKETTELRSPYTNIPWQATSHQSTCLSEEYPRCSETPGEYCDCGIYAYHDFWFPRITDQPEQGNSKIAAAIAGKGKTHIHHDGFRTSEAQIICFYKKRSTEEVDKLVKNYSVPLFQDQSQFEAFASRYATRLENSEIPEVSQLALF